MARQSSQLQKELRQSRPFHSIYQEAALSVLKTADVIRRDVTKQLESYDLTAQQYNVLRILRGAGKEGLPTLSIGERLIEETPGMTRLLDRLEAKGLVRRERCEQDRRQVLCYLTAEGTALLARLDPAVGETEKTLAGRLTESEAETLVELLEKLRKKK